MLLEALHYLVMISDVEETEIFKVRVSLSLSLCVCVCVCWFLWLVDLLLGSERLFRSALHTRPKSCVCVCWRGSSTCSWPLTALPFCATL